MIHDTIIARASAPGSAYRGIIRISGQRAVDVVKTITAHSLADTPSEDCILCLPQSFDCGSVNIPAKLLFWQAGHSYTGDETVEIHTFGSPVLLDVIMAALLSASEEVRLAKPGEFTLRAFLSGRLDLSQAEAVLGVIDAENDTDLKTALHQLAGNVSAPLSAVRTLLFEILVQLEASLDFAEEVIPTVLEEELRQTLTHALEQVESIRQKIAHRGITDGKPRIVLAGPPNVGKSTLFNKLLKRDAALVSPLAGTTRDYLEAEIDWDGIPAVLVDTAGIGDAAANELDEAAQTKAKELAEHADIVVWCEEEYNMPAGSAAQWRDRTIRPADPVILPRCVSGFHPGCEKTFFFQTKTPHENIESLKKEVAKLLRRSPQYGMLPNTALRCREALNAAGESLIRALELIDTSLIALELRNAVNQLGLIDGTVHTEDILESIFSQFCIGK